jgi:hypothetical protein
MDADGFKELLDTLAAVVNTARIDRDSIDPNDAASLASHANRALFMTGKIQGLEYAINHFNAVKAEKDEIDKSLADAKEEVERAKG